MGTSLSLLFIAVGAILAFAVNVHTSVVTLSTVGWILIVVGALGLAVSRVLLVRRERVIRDERFVADDYGR
jgi:uncharacterized membrane protein